MEKNVQTWECGKENASDVIAKLEGTTLTIMGNGEMEDYDYNNRNPNNDRKSPWDGQSIVHVVIQQGVKSIGTYAFAYCYGLTSLNISDSVVHIGNNAFYDCTGLESITIPCGVISIGYGAFWKCCGLTCITIPGNVTSIGNCAFFYCDRIEFISILEGVVSIGNQAFQGCTRLKSITIPESVTSIGYYAFQGCTGLKSITIPSGAIIGGATFNGCTELTEIKNLNPVPQKINNPPFELTVSLYVPASRVDVYKRATWWKELKSIMPIFDDSVEPFTVKNIDLQISTKKQEIENIKQKIENCNKEIESLKHGIVEFEQDIERLKLKKVLLRGIVGNPKHVAQFMSLFNQREGLKYLTHEFDESGGFDMESFLAQFQKVCTENFAKLCIPKTLNELLNQFAFEKNPKWQAFDNQFNSKENTSGWSSSEWEESKDNKLHPIKHTGFAEIIKDFKRTTRIESPYLETLVGKVFANEEFDIEKKDLSKADFYTHVGEFKSALETIFEEIQKRSDTPDKKKVSVEYKKRNADDYAIREIVISHHNSYPTNGDEESLIREWLSLEKGNMGKIANHLQGYCHWSVVTKIGDKPMRVNILREQDTPTHEEVEASEVKGFTHILTFYHQS